MKGYYANFLRTKSLKKGQIKKDLPKKKVMQKAGLGLSDVQAMCYQWLVDNSIIKVLDNPTRESLVDAVTVSKFQALFKIGRFFNVVVSPPNSQDIRVIAKSLTLLIRALQEKSILPVDTDIDRIVRKDRSEVTNLLVNLHQWAVKGMRKGMSNSRKEFISKWLSSLGLRPAIGDDWFNNKLSLMEDKVRNGELLRSLCVAFRPEVFEGPLPPAKSPREMVERVRQALVVLAEEGAIQNADIQKAEDMVRGTTDAAEIVILKAKKEYEKREKMMIEKVAILNDSLIL